MATSTATTPTATPGVRAERQAQTRERILASAERRFREQGFGGTSLEDVAREAGFSKGAVYSNFDGKADLFFAVAERQFATLRDALRSAVEAAPDLLSQLQAVTDWYGEFLQVESDWLRSLPELMPLAAQDPHNRSRVSALLRSVEVALVELLERQQELMGIRFALPPTTIAALAVSMVVGLTVRTVHGLDAPDPAASTTLFTHAMATLLQLA